MPFTKYGVANQAQGQLLAGISGSATSAILKSGQGGLFPPSLECPFYIKAEKYDTALNNFRVLKRELIKVTNRAGDVLTIERSAGYCPADYAATTQTNTAFSFDADDTITQVLIGEQIEEIQAAVEGKVDTVAGLRTGMTANGVMGTDGSGNEVVVLGAGFVASGMITPYAGASAPAGFLLCDGSAVSRTTYAALFSVTSTTYGAGDGSTTFNLPNLKWRVPVGKDTWQTEFDVLWETGGAKTHTLSATEMPSHTHDYKSSVTSYWSPSGTTNLSSTDGTSMLTSNSTSTAWWGQSHNNLQPYIVLNYIIKT